MSMAAQYVRGRGTGFRDESNGPLVKRLSTGNDYCPRRSKSNERIGEYYPNRNIIESFGQLRFG